MTESAQNYQTHGSASIEGLDDVFTVNELDASQDANIVSLDANRRELDANWLSVEQAAERLGISIRAVQKRLKKGTLSGQKEKTSSGERWLIDASELDASQHANIVSLDANPNDQGANSDELDANNEDVSDKLIRDLQAKLEAASYRIGYLEAQLDAERQQVKLLTDSQHKNGWWARFQKWYSGG